jgi:hypothetical protein
MCREDEITPLPWGQDFAAAVPGARAVIEGCGHLPNLEKPQELNRAVVGFLSERKKKRTSSAAARPARGEVTLAPSRIAVSVSHGMTD